MKHDPDNLKRLIRIVDGLRNGLPPVTPGRIESYAEHKKAAIAVLEKLEREEGARWSHNYAGTRLRLAGISTSCTAGPGGALSNWIAAAQKRLAEAVFDSTP